MGLGFKVWGLGFGVWGFNFWVLGVGGAPDEHPRTKWAEELHPKIILLLAVVEEVLI